MFKTKHSGGLGDCLYNSGKQNVIKVGYALFFLFCLKIKAYQLLWCQTLRQLKL